MSLTSLTQSFIINKAEFVLAVATGKAFSCLWTYIVRIYLIHIPTLKNLAYCWCQIRSCSTEAADAWGEESCSIQPLSTPAASLPLQGSSSVVPLNLDASPSASDYRNRQMRAGKNWNFLFFFWGVLSCLLGLSLLLSLAVLSLRAASCTAKP